MASCRLSASLPISPGEFRFFSEVLEALGLGGLLEQAPEFQVAALAGVFRVEQILHISECFAVHRSGEIVFLSSYSEFHESLSLFQSCHRCCCRILLSWFGNHRNLLERICCADPGLVLFLAFAWHGQAKGLFKRDRLCL